MWLTHSSLVGANRPHVMEMKEGKGGRTSCFVTTSVDTLWAVTWCPISVSRVVKCFSSDLTLVHGGHFHCSGVLLNCCHPDVKSYLYIWASCVSNV